VISTLVFIAAQPLIIGPIFPEMKPHFENFRVFLVSDIHSGLLVYWLIIAIYQGIDYYRKFIDKELRASQLEARLVTAQLDALRMQLHPHFLFNTLNSVSVLMRRDADQAERMLVQLSSLLRVTLARNAAHEVQLRQELDILEAYLEIERIRFQDRLTVRMHIDPPALDALVPQLFFQPLVENAIRHGIATRESGGEIDIQAECRNGVVRLEVRDNGPGLTARGDQLVEGIGLSNTRSRLAYLYGTASSLSIRNGEDGGLIVAATVPFHTEKTTPAGE
jgi:sensor histidine kinase YesM